MTDDVRGQPVVVTLHGDCRCPGSPHPTGDTVTLRPDLSTPMGVEAWAAIRGASSPADIEGRLAEVWLRRGIADWTFCDEKGAMVPITPANIERLLPFSDGGFEVANAADALYADQFFRPLVARQSTSSPPTSTEDSTSASPPSGDTPPTPSSPSPRRAPAGKPSEVPVP